MEFKQGTSVYSSDGQEVGRIDRVVLEPATHEVTHLVIRQGFLFTEDKVVPIHLVESATEERVILRYMANALDLPKFEETHYISADEPELEVEGVRRTRAVHDAPPLVWYPPLGMTWWGAPGYVDYPAEEAVVNRNIPEGTVPLREGAHILSADGDHVGNLERVYTDSETARATHLLISQGVIFKSKKLVPTSWIKRTDEDDIELKLGTHALDKLPEYEGS